jgi:hypothetical protein
MRDDAWKRVGPAELFDLAELYDAAGLDVVVESDPLQESLARSMTGLHLEADGTYAGRIPLPPDENLAWYVEVQSGDLADPGFVSDAVKVEPACPPGE